MAEKQYKVTAPCVVHIPVSTSDGPMLSTFYTDAVLPAGVPEEKLKHLLDSNLIEEVGGKTKAEPKKESDEEPETPKPLDVRSSKADLVAHAVANGMNQEDAEKLKRDELLDMYVRPPAE
ncbi:MAG TPA: hypothetical protein VNC22_14260 [Sporichthya sp.]|nr:hypothetical protein [Sporichthya sp.]